jgi:hypothetical protein
MSDAAQFLHSIQCLLRQNEEMIINNNYYKGKGKGKGKGHPITGQQGPERE